MTTFESTVRQIDAPQEKVYNLLSDMNNIEKVKDRIPADKAEGLTFSHDSVGITTPMGAVRLAIVDREPCKTIKFATLDSPIPFNFWIQLLPMSETESKMKLTIKAELNPFIKGMVQKPLQQAIEKLADALQNINYK